MRDHEDQFVGGPFTWFIGEVRDISDPLNMNRIRVFPYGYYDDERVATSDLPWSTVMMSNAHASLKGNGGNHHLEVGSWVVGFFRDGYSAQDAIVIGSIPTKTEGTIDIPPESSETNKVYKSKAGHLIELDNTSGEERVHLKHASGTYVLLDKDGTVYINSSNTTVDITGNTTVHGNLLINGTTHSTGDVSTDAGNAPTLATHKHKEVPGTGGASSPTPSKAYTSEPFAGSAGPIQFDEEGNEI